MIEPEAIHIQRPAVGASSATICIGVPVFNGAAYLAQALDSLLAQTHADFRIVIVDDGSTDNSLTILERYAQCDARIMLYRNPARTGLVAAWRQVAELADKIVKPDYFSWFSDHDWVERDWLEKLLTALQSDRRMCPQWR